MPAPLLIPLAIKACCWLAAISGTCYCAKKAADAYGKNSKRQKERLALKGKSIDQAREDNKKLQTENGEWKKKYEENEKEIRDLEKKTQEAKGKSNDPNLSEEERIVWRNKARGYEDQVNTLRGNNKNIFTRIKGLESQIKDNNKVISGTLSNLNDSHWIWDFLTLENILIMVAVYAMYKILKEDDKK